MQRPGKETDHETLEHLGGPSEMVRNVCKSELSIDGISAEYVCCPGCEADDWVDYARYRDVDYGVPGAWTLVLCRCCHLIYMNPRPKEEAFDLIYPSNYVPYQIDSRPDTRCLMRLGMKMAYEGPKLKILQKIALPERPFILDVGCGAGFFL
jgi:hypothetical protein